MRGKILWSEFGYLTIVVSSSSIYIFLKLFDPNNDQIYFILYIFLTVLHIIKYADCCYFITYMLFKKNRMKIFYTISKNCYLIDNRRRVFKPKGNKKKGRETKHFLTLELCIYLLSYLFLLFYFFSLDL